MAKFYYVAVHAERRGPVTLEAMADQPLSPETPVWHRELKSWTRAEQVAELKPLLECQPPPLPPPPPPVSNDDDFLLCNPALPKMARVACVFAIVVNPAIWLMQNAFCLFSGRHQDVSSALGIDAAGALIGLGTTMLLLIGGLKLRVLKPSGLVLLHLGLWADLVSSVVLFCMGLVIGLSQNRPQQASARVTDRIGLCVGIGALAFEVILLVWLLRKRRRMRAILRREVVLPAK